MSRHRKIFIFENQYALTNYLLKQWMIIAKEAVERQKQFTVALSGGRTSVEFYCRLSGLEDFDLWKHTHIFLTDERFVPCDHAESNFQLIKKNIFDYVNIPDENIHSVNTALESPEVSAKSYEKELIQFFELTRQGEWPRFDFMLLGLGEDGHTASLFPEGEEFNEMNRLAVPVNIEKLMNERISLTLPVINNARKIVFCACGRAKAGIIKRIIDEEKQFPASHVEPLNGELIFLLDKDAARELSYQDSYSHCGEAIMVEDK